MEIQCRFGNAQTSMQTRSGLKPLPLIDISYELNSKLYKYQTFFMYYRVKKLNFRICPLIVILLWSCSLSFSLWRVCAHSFCSTWSPSKHYLVSVRNREQEARQGRCGEDEVKRVTKGQGPPRLRRLAWDWVQLRQAIHK